MLATASERPAFFKFWIIEGKEQTREPLVLRTWVHGADSVSSKRAHGARSLGDIALTERLCLYPVTNEIRISKLEIRDNHELFKVSELKILHSYLFRGSDFVFRVSSIFFCI